MPETSPKEASRKTGPRSRGGDIRQKPHPDLPEPEKRQAHPGHSSWPHRVRLSSSCNFSRCPNARGTLTPSCERGGLPELKTPLLSASREKSSPQGQEACPTGSRQSSQQLRNQGPCSTPSYLQRAICFFFLFLAACRICRMLIP